MYLAAAPVAASALTAVIAYRYVDLGPIGPLPDLYEPVWYPEKVVAAAGEAVALWRPACSWWASGPPADATPGDHEPERTRRSVRPGPLHPTLRSLHVDGGATAKWSTAELH